MSTSDADALALRALAEYGGKPQLEDEDGAIWEVPGVPWSGTFSNFARDAEILAPPYCDTLLGAVTRRLRADGWQVTQQASGKYVSARMWRSVDEGGFGHDPDHAVLALGRAMRGAGIIRTEAQA